MGISRLEDARALAQAFLDSGIQPEISIDVRLGGEREFPTCWMFGYNSRAYIEHGDISHALAGGGPIIVNRTTGEVRSGSSALPMEAQQDPA